MGAKFTTTLTLFNIIITTYLTFSTTTNALDPCASQPDLTIILVYCKCSPFKPNAPNIDPWTDTISNMALKDPTRLNYLASLGQ